MTRGADHCCDAAVNQQNRAAEIAAHAFEHVVWLWTENRHTTRSDPQALFAERAGWVVLVPSPRIPPPWCRIVLTDVGEKMV